MTATERTPSAARRRSVLLVQPSVQPPGGSNGVTAWMIQALQDRHDVSVLTRVPFDAAPVNRFYGTAIDAAKVTPILVRPALFDALAKTSLRLALLKNSVLFRLARAHARRFDLAISTWNEADLGQPGMQYVHYPTYDFPRPGVDLRDYHAPALLRLYHGACERIAGGTRAGMAKNVTLVNSDWTGRAMARVHPGVTPTTLYPPIAGDFPDVAWGARAPGFVCIGRIAPEKALDRVFDILGAVRARHPEVRLHLVGTGPDNGYTRHVLARAAAERAWVTHHSDLSRAALVELIAQHRFGIHAMAEEHFGMVVGEMVRGGMVPFVPDGGGQVEIVGRDEALLYRSDEDAVARIARALADPAWGEALHERLRPRRELFSEATFVARVRALVDGWFASAPCAA